MYNLYWCSLTSEVRQWLVALEVMLNYQLLRAYMTNPITLSWSKSSEVCLKELLWPTLLLRRQYLSILTLYDMLHKGYPLNFSDYCTLSATRTREHALAFLPTQSSINAYRYSFLLTSPFYGTLFHLSS